MRPTFRVALSVVVLGLSCALPLRAQGAKDRPKVAVLPLSYGTVGNWWGNEDIGKGIADMIEAGLLEDGSFRVFERTKVDAMLTEQDFNASDRVDPTQKAAKLGKMIGVRYMIYGSITKFGTENDSKGVNAGAFGGGKYGLGTVGTKSGKAFVSLTVKATDTTTGEVMFSAQNCEGTSKRSGVLVGGAGGGGGKGAGGGLNMGSSNFRETIIGEATDLAVKAAVAKIIAKKNLLEGGH